MNSQFSILNSQLKNPLSPEQKLLQALKLYHSAMELKIAALKQFYPNLSEAEIKDKAKRIFFDAR